MDNEPISVELEIKNQKGLHARAAAAFVKAIENMDAVVEVERIGTVVNGCSIMGLMMLSASKGTIVKITARGNDAVKAINILSGLLHNKFNEE